MTTLDFEPGARARIRFPEADTLTKDEATAVQATMVTSLLFGETWDAGDKGTVLAWPEDLTRALDAREISLISGAVNFQIDGQEIHDGVGIIMAKGLLVLEDAQ